MTKIVYLILDFITDKNERKQLLESLQNKLKEFYDNVGKNTNCESADSFYLLMDALNIIEVL
jgi:hypothetical protein